MDLIPAINGKITKTGGSLQLPSLLRVVCLPQEHGAAAVLKERLENSCGITVDLESGAPKEGAFVQVKKAENAPAEKHGWYKIEAAANGVITAEYADEDALHSALASLFQLLRAAYKNGGGLEAQTFSDRPVYLHRGLHLDTARHFFEAEEIERIIEQISLVKMNVLHWHFADDQAWRLESESYPLLTQSCGKDFYTQAQAKSLVQFAKNRGVKIIPEFEIPGHSSAAVSVYPSLTCSGKKINPPKTGGIFPFIMCGGKQGSYDFIESIIGELCDIFPSDMIHIGGDEAPKSEWEKCPHCAQKLKDEGLSSHHDLQGYMLNFANGLLKKQGRKAVCWNDCLKAQNLDEDIIVQYWMEMGKASYSMPSISGGRQTILSNVSPFYFDYPHSMFNMQDIYMYRPRLKKKQPAGSFNIGGIECAVWTERIETADRLEYMVFPRAVGVAEIAWSARRNYADFRRRLRSYYSVFKEYKINAAPIREAEIHGSKRFKDKAGFIFEMTKGLGEMSKAGKEMRRNAE